MEQIFEKFEISERKRNESNNKKGKKEKRRRPRPCTFSVNVPSGHTHFCCVRKKTAECVLLSLIVSICAPNYVSFHFRLHVCILFSFSIIYSTCRHRAARDFLALPRAGDE